MSDSTQLDRLHGYGEGTVRSVQLGVCRGRRVNIVALSEIGALSTRIALAAATTCRESPLDRRVRSQTA